MKHKHAELMMMYAQDAMETDTPWERWEYAPEVCQGKWFPITWHPGWAQSNEYRRRENIETLSKIKQLEDKLNSLDARVERLYSNDLARQQADYLSQINRGRF